VAPAEGLYLVKVDYDAEAEFDAVLTDDNSC
jgi:hypothetical protein